MQLVSTKTADKNEVIKLSKDLENQMKVRQERETGIYNNSEKFIF